jgi:hypothetical protein
MAVEKWVEHWVLAAHSEVYLFHFGHDPNWAYCFDVHTTQQSFLPTNADAAKIGLTNPPETTEDPVTHKLTYFFRVRNSGNTLGNFTIFVQKEA